MANKMGDSTAILQPIQLEKSSASFVMNQRNILQQMGPKEQSSSNILHARSSLK